MFKKLKDKIAEEISPQRIQQLTQSVTDKLQQNNINLTNSNNTSNQIKEDNFFSLTEDDASPPKSANNSGFIDVSLNAASTPQMEKRVRRNSNSSIASDVSFLPRYESSFNYHLQSDLDISASEIEDNVSQQSSQLGHVSKEQVYSAFTKAQMRYHKYRGRYTDLANHYKELERENAKMKAVLVETQDKAIRRVSELREQCSLSQKAKADLEHALRTELEEKLIVIGTLKDKIGLLQNNSESEEKSQEIKAQAIVEAEYKDRLSSLEKTLQEVEDREKVNNLKFAKSKMELHTEIQNRELEITNLKSDLETLHHELEGYETQNNSNLRVQNTKLIETCENLDLKCKHLEAENLKLEQYKLEIADLKEERVKTESSVMDLQSKLTDVPVLEAKIREFENNVKELDKANIKLRETLAANEKIVEELNGKLNTANDESAKFKEESERIQEETKVSLLHLEEKIRAKLEADFKEQKAKLQEDFQTKLQQIEINDQDSKQLQIKLMESDQSLKDLQTISETLKADLHNRMVAYKALETNHLELIEENNARGVDLNNLKKSQKLEVEKLEKFLREKEEQLNNLTNDFDESKRKLDIKEADLAKINEELQLTKCNLEKLQETTNNLEQEVNITSQEKLRLEEVQVKHLKRLQSLEENIKTLSEENIVLKEKSDKSNSELKKTNISLEKSNKKLQKMLDINKLKLDQLNVQNNQLQETYNICLGNLQQAEKELKDLYSENSTLKDNAEKLEMDAQKRCSEIEEHFRIKENERQCNLERMEQENAKLKTVEVNLLKVIDENLLLKQNLDKNDLLLKDKFNLLEEQNRELLEYKQLKDAYEGLKEDMSIVNIENNDLKLSCGELESSLRDMRKDNDQKLKELKEQIELLRKQLDDQNINVDKHGDLEIRFKELQDKYTNIIEVNKKMSAGIADLEESKLQIDELRKEIVSQSSEIAAKDKQILVLTEEAELLSKEEIGKLSDELNNLHKIIKDMHVEKQQLSEQVSRLKNVEMQFNEVSSNNHSIEMKLKGFQDEVGELKLHNSHISSDNQHLLEENDKLLAECTDIKIKYESFDVLKSELEVKLNAAKEKNDRLESELKTIYEEASVLKKAKKDLESNQINPNETDELRNKLLDLNDKFEQTLEENGLIKNEFNEIRKELEVASNEKRKLQTQVNDLEHHCSELSHERQLLKDEIEELKITPINFNQSEVDNLRDKLAQYKSIDATNRNSIEFYENELQKMRNKNEKLNRKLDETLVTLNHCTDLSASTEIEYLKNVLYNYMLGKESLVMARVLAAVCKFDTQQTDAVLKHEQHKQSLLGQLGII